jgi:uncharacterized protein (TIGR03000 family)
MRPLFGLVALATACLSLSSNIPVRAEAPDSNKEAVIITMIVPADAVVSFDGTRTTQTGTRRTYYSPPVATGKTFKYQIEVADGQEKVKRDVAVRGGERITLDFRGGQVRETRGSGSAFFEPEAAGAAPAYVPSTFTRPGVVPLGGREGDRTSSWPYGFGGAIGGG